MKELREKYQSNLNCRCQDSAIELNAGELKDLIGFLRLLLELLVLPVCVVLMVTSAIVFLAVAKVALLQASAKVPLSHAAVRLQLFQIVVRELLKIESDPRLKVVTRSAIGSKLKMGSVRCLAWVGE